MGHSEALAELRADIAAAGYFPQLVEDSVLLGLGDEEVLAHVVRHEATFADDSLLRHLTVLVLTASRLLVSHTDENSIDLAPSQAASTCEAISLGSIRSVSLTRVVSRPEGFGSAQAEVTEAWLVVGWGTMRRLDIEPAGCEDPNCDADHGYTGALTEEDLTLRVSAAADGAAMLDRLVRFGVELQRRTGRGTTRAIGTHG